MRRREFLAMLTAAGLAGSGPAAAHARRVERVGVQLYTVRDLLAADPAATLDAIAAAGYAEVETAGLAGLTPAAFRAALDAAGLLAPSAHVPLDAIERNSEAVLADAAVLGYQYLVLPWLAPRQRTSLDSYRHVADVLNRFGEECAAVGIQLAYHNHDFEFVALEGVVPFDLLLERCDPALVQFEMDLFWAAAAGIDAAAYFRTHPGRYPLCHVKDRTAAGEMVAVGDGVIDFPALFAAGRGLKHYFVEHDNPVDPLASIRRSIGSVRGLRY